MKAKQDIRKDIRSKRGLKKESSFQEALDALTPEDAEEIERQNLLKSELELQIELRAKALPIIERPLACEGMTEAEASECANKDAEELKRQKIHKRKQAMAAVAQEEKWMLFNNADFFDDNDIQELSDFMDKLFKKVPNVFWNKQESEIYSEELNRISASRENSRDIITVSRENSRELISIARENSAEKLLKLNKIKIKNEQDKGIDGNLNDYRLPSGLVTSKVAKDIIEVYKRGGKLNPLSVQKLLRLAYKVLKTMPNTTKINVRANQKLTVVGDIHGFFKKKYYIHHIYDIM
jgi:hypothetical protein